MIYEKMVKLIGYHSTYESSNLCSKYSSLCRVSRSELEKAALGKSKIVKDMTKDEIVKALKGYKDGSYGGAMKGVMKGQVAKLTDKDIEEIAEAHGKK